MDTSLAFGTALLTAIAIGLGCGIGCGSISTPFIITKLLGDQKNSKESIFALLSFVFGKVITLVILGALTSIIGGEVLSLISGVLPFDLSIFFRLACILFGLSILYKTIKKKDKCASKCAGCNSGILEKPSLWKTQSYFLSGVLYALTPCPPLTAVLIYAVTINPLSAAILLAVFGLANSITPLVIYAPLTGYIVVRMKKEIPKYIGGVQILAGVLLIILGTGLIV
ncbi:sulfite exporter TauE/SafE family protein [Oceanirhabdus seepicola]|uniref:Sulfite exporter TauE/SafE family protein n=1 Tax=Oceanirhabdus seepicola TaxID=2828781 RepID=A0A9J6NVR2_9CLOT|nr:sulfite exporter TauE/SafE family protein [Oceanirhabdus seepicola]MCM1988347.1 sulfite exporter TauE/SafE family protein [Oceanirhabdus seepicola]